MKADVYKIFLLIFTTSLVTAINSNANWIKKKYPTLPQSPQHISAGQASNVQVNSGMKDSLPAGVTEDWLKSLRDENGNRMITQEPEQDFIQRRIFDGFSSNEYFGCEVSMSGDVNGDGFNDIAIGATYNNPGRVYLYFGGPSLDTEPDVILNGVADSSEFGNHLTFANVNGDSYGDLIVGASHYNSNTGRVYVFYGGATLDTIADVTMTGENTGDFFGICAGADVNNDGYDDIIVGADGNNSNRGKAYIYFGGASMNNVPDVTMNGQGGNHHFGVAVSSAGDVNNDGFDDVIVGAHGIRKAYIFYGGTNMNNADDVVLAEGVGEGAFGVVVSTAGDVNGDGFSDVIVGADRYGNSVGRAYIYYGDSSMDSTADVTMTGENSDDYFGCEISSAGDINKDGYSDVVVVAYIGGIGKVYVYFGSSTMNNVADIIINDATFASQVAGGGDVTGDGNPDFLVGAFRCNTNRGRVYLYDYSVGGNSTSNSSSRVLTGPKTFEYFGSSVSSGDMNGDGYNDVVIGSGDGHDTGKAYIFFGGTVWDTIPDIVMLGEPDSELGISVSSADVNKDGYDDAIFGAGRYNSDAGRVYILFGGTSMDNVPDRIMTGEPGSMFGMSVSSAGDVNKDGYHDVIVGASQYGSNTGRAYIYFGGSPMDTIPDVILEGEATNNLFGYAVSSAGDVNKDGYSDVIVGARGYLSNVGKAYIFYGGTTMDATADIPLNGENGYFGESVSSAGDVNGDGFSDVIVGAYRYGPNNDGKVYLYYGGSSMDNSADLTFIGSESDAFLGNANTLSNAGDLNKDGYSDIIMAEPFTGKAYVYFGGALMDTIPDIIKYEETPNENLVAVSSGGYINGDGHLEFIVGTQFYNSSTGKVYVYDYRTYGEIIPDLIMSGNGINNYLGESVSSAGDVNNDGYSDFIVGAPGEDSYKGKAYIFFGGVTINNVSDVILFGEATGDYFGMSVSSAGDVNNDGFDDVLVGASHSGTNVGRAYIFYGGSSMDNNSDLTLYGEGGHFGISVSTAGNVNGDQFSDIVVGAYRYGSSNGKAYVYFGGANMDNAADLTMTGDEPLALFGMSVSTAGDVNRDGFSDIIIGAAHDFAEADTGKVYIYYGGLNMDSLADHIIYGQQLSDDFGAWVSNADDVNGDGFSDVIVGALTYNYFYGPQDGRAYIYYGGASMNTSADVIFHGDPNSHFGKVSSVGDINSDGYSDVIIGAHYHNAQTGLAKIYFGGAVVDTSADVIMYGELNYSEYGFASSAGDVNGDGFPDVIVGAHKYNSNTGRAYIYLASAIGSPSNKEFRTKTSGNWNSPLSWEMSTNGGSSWVPATSFPNNTSDSITIRSSHIIHLTKNDSAEQTYIESGGQLIVDSLSTFRVNDLFIAGTLSVNGTVISFGTIEYNGTSSQTLVTSNVNFANLKINNPAGVSLDSNFSIRGLLSIVNGDLNLNGKTITLLDTAQLIETPGNTVKGDSGSIKTTRNIYHPNSLNIAGLGAVITSSSNLGATTVTRQHNFQNVSVGRPSIRRNFTISPANNNALDANFVFKYDESELDTLVESSLRLFHSIDGGTNYSVEGGIVDIVNNQISLTYVQTFSRWTAARDSLIGHIGSELTDNLYAKGKLCIQWGSEDTIAVRINSSEIPLNDSIEINYVIKKLSEPFNTIFNTTFTIPYFSQDDTIIFLKMPFIGNIGPYSVIVQAIPDELNPINGFDIRSYCFDVTCDAFSYTEPCDTMSGGTGFDGSKGRMVAGFKNLSETDDFPIHAIDQSFLDSNVGNVRYKLAIYEDDSSGKPGNPLYISQELQTPPRSGLVESVTHQLNTPINIPPKTRFYVGYIQISDTNIKVSFQDEVPVRSNAFYFSNSDSGNEWHDFADSSKNFRMFISPRTNPSSTDNLGTSLTLHTFLEGFYNISTNEMKRDTVNLQIEILIRLITRLIQQEPNLV